MNDDHAQSTSFCKLEEYAIEGEVGKAYYIPNFVTEEEEVYLLRQIDNAPKPKWKELAKRRLQVWGGDLTPANKLFPQAMPSFLSTYPDIIGRLKATGAFVNSKHAQPNHIIVNEYLPKQGIMPHEDGPSYHPVVATISLGSHTVFHYYRYKPEADGDTSAPPFSEGSQVLPQSVSSEVRSKSGRAIDMSNPVLTLLLEPRSLVITTCELYTSHLHGIDPLHEDTFPSVSASESETRMTDGGSGSRAGNEGRSMSIANLSMLGDERLKELVRAGGTVERRTRVSLTCRDVEKVVGMPKFGSKR